MLVGVDFLWIFFFFGLFSFELIAVLFCVKFCATKFFFFRFIIIYGVI